MGYPFKRYIIDNRGLGPFKINEDGLLDVMVIKYVFYSFIAYQPSANCRPQSSRLLSVT